jgi:cytochrome c5
MKKISALFILTLVAIACNPKVSEVIVEDTKEAEVELYAGGKTLYESKCITCHALKPVTNYTKEQWDKILPAMMEKAKLTVEEKVEVNNYVYWKIEK